MTSAPPVLPRPTSPVFLQIPIWSSSHSYWFLLSHSSSVAPSFNSSSLAFFYSAFLFHSSHQSMFFSVSIHKSLLTSPLTCHPLPIWSKPVCFHIKSALFFISINPLHAATLLSKLSFLQIKQEATESKTEQPPFRVLPWVLPFKWILTQLLLIPYHHFNVFCFFHLSIHPFIPVPSFMTGLSADINQLREKIPH